MSNFKWRDNHTPKFLELYQREECLWNVKSEVYKNVTMRAKSYERIRSDMEIEGLSISDVKNKIKSIRTTYKVELTKLLKATGTEDVYIPRLFWFAQADVFLRGVSVPRESKSNLAIISHTQDEDHPESGTVNFDYEPLVLHEEEANTVAPSTSKSNTTITTERVAQCTSQPKRRKVQDPHEHAINKLQSISEQCKEAEEDEFDLFCKSLACQLKKMPLERALICQAKLQSVMTRERLHQINTSAPHSNNSSDYSAASSYPTSPTDL